MADVRTRLSAVDQVKTPDLWQEARRRSAREDVGWVEPRAATAVGWRRAGTIAVALALVAAGVTLVWRAFAPTEAPRPGTSPAPETSDPWRDLQPGLHELPPPPASRIGPALVWTGSDLVMWGGALDDGARLFDDGFMFDAHTRAWEEMAASPLSPRYFPAAVWSGREVLIWGGWDGDRGFFGDGAAYDPATSTWRRLPPAPIEARIPFGAIWTAEEMVVWGTGPPQPGKDVSGAAYDPATNSWRRIADAPFPLNDGETVWTGGEMIVYGAWLGDGNRPDTETAVGAAYDPRTDAWRRLPPVGLSPQALDAVWTGDEMIVIDYLHDVAAYDPVRNRWRGLPPLPLDEGEYVPQAAYARGNVLVDSYGGFAVFDVRTESWDQLMIERDLFAREVISVGSAIMLVGHGERDNPPPPTLLWKPVTDPDWKEGFED